MHDLHHLDLVELVLADHAARVLAVASGLGAEARRMRGEPDRQRLGRQDLAAHGVRQRDLGRRDEVEPLGRGRIVRVDAALLHREHVGFEFRQLRRADQRLGVDDVGRVALGVAVLARLRVEHELRERAVQPREPAAQEREARAGELGRRGEVEQPEAFADVGVVARPESRTRAACPSGAPRRCRRHDLPTGTLECVRFGRSSRKSRSSACTRSSSPSRRFVSVADPGHLGEQRGGVLALALGGADLLRQRVALRLQVLRAGLDVLALALERLEARGVERQAALGESGGDRRQIVAKKIDVEHAAILANERAWRIPRPADSDVTARRRAPSGPARAAIRASRGSSPRARDRSARTTTLPACCPGNSARPRRRRPSSSCA